MRVRVGMMVFAIVFIIISIIIRILIFQISAHLVNWCATFSPNFIKVFRVVEVLNKCCKKKKGKLHNVKLNSFG